MYTPYVGDSTEDSNKDDKFHEWSPEAQTNPKWHMLIHIAMYLVNLATKVIGKQPRMQ